MAMLKVDHLSVHYGVIQAVKDVSFEVNEGEVVTLIGANGAGKTSIYKSIYYDENKDEKRINTDEMVARIGSWRDNNLQMKCAREAVKLIRQYINNYISFNQETTLSGNSIVKNIKNAKEKGHDKSCCKN